MRRGIGYWAAALGALAFFATGSGVGGHPTTVKMVAKPNPPVPSPAPTPTPTTPVRPERPQVDCAEVKCVALTFDDGPGFDTGRLLDTLRKHKVHATFFVVGPQARHFKHDVERAFMEGHELGVHTEHHLQLNRRSMSKKKIHDEIDRTRQTLKDFLGVDVTVFRPPYGATDKRVRAETKKEGLAQILWSIDTLDWQSQNTASIVRRATRGLRRGSIVLMHDIYPTTVAAVPRILKACEDKGLTPVTVTELLGGETVPGKEYFDAHEAR
ncbi:polysaccharide deacetylase family protein [Actinocorallia longicatena]|uniref:NodB homology domain-containing protein n=1 Tax=Actinocorallia longicatena TaxID=111803 RepID=A0ABP6Q948_9ACTN